MEIVKIEDKYYKVEIKKGKGDNVCEGCYFHAPVLQFECAFPDKVEVTNTLACAEGGRHSRGIIFKEFNVNKILKKL